MGHLTAARAHPAPHMQELDNDALFERPWHVENTAHCYFYHTIDLPEFGLQDGGWDLRGRYDDYIGGTDLSDKRVLDVGTASGFLSFQAEARGAREVVSFDLDDAGRQHLLPFASSEYVTDHEQWRRKHTEHFKSWKRSYWLTHRLLGSSCKVVYGDVYNLPPALGAFDVIILGAILEHLIDPLSALYSVSRLARDTIVINTDYFDNPMHLAVFNGRADNPQASYTFWTYSIATYDEYMAILGFEPVAQRKSAFAGTRAAPGAPRPMLDRVALVYRRRQ